MLHINDSLSVLCLNHSLGKAPLHLLSYHHGSYNLHPLPLHLLPPVFCKPRTGESLGSSGPGEQEEELQRQPGLSLGIGSVVVSPETLRLVVNWLSYSTQTTKRWYSLRTHGVWAHYAENKPTEQLKTISSPQVFVYVFNK